MKVYFALDESGKLSINDICTHFIIGGFIYSDKDYVKNAIRKTEAAVKAKYHISTNTELKGSGFNESAVADFINGVFDEAHDKIIPVFSVVSKDELGENFTMSESLAYNFFVDNLFHYYSKRLGFTRYANDISILMDQRNLKKDEENDLENILKTNYIEKPYSISTYYMSSKNADVIRFADILDHVIYHLFNNKDGDKTQYFKEHIKEAYLKRIKNGVIYYPFKQSYFDELTKIANLRDKSDATQIIERLKRFSTSERK
jgi:hypothetical protein